MPAPHTATASPDHTTPQSTPLGRTLAPLVDEEGRRLRVGRFDPGREEPPLVGLVPQVLVQVRVRDLLQRLNVMVDRHQVAVQVHKLDTDLTAAQGKVMSQR